MASGDFPSCTRPSFPTKLFSIHQKQLQRKMRKYLLHFGYLLWENPSSIVLKVVEMNYVLNQNGMEQWYLGGFGVYVFKNEVVNFCW